MYYLNQKSVDFFRICLLEAAKKKDKRLPLGRNNKVNLFLQILSEDEQQTIFSVNIPNDIFSVSISYQRGIMFPFCYVDNEHLPDKKLYSIDELELTKGAFSVRYLHFPILRLLDSLVDSLTNYVQNQEKYFNELEEYSFRTIRLLFVLFIIENGKYCSWGVEYAEFQYNTLSIKVNGHHFKGIVRIRYNIGGDYFEIDYMDSFLNKVQESCTMVYLGELIDTIDKRVEYIKEYGNK
jgi:hypothetical protein